MKNITNLNFEHNNELNKIKKNNKGYVVVKISKIIFIRTFIFKRHKKIQSE